MYLITYELRQVERERGEVLPVTVEQVSLEHGPALLLVVSVGLGLVLVVSVAVVPGGAVGFPGAQTDPAEVCLASLVLADHMVAAAVLLDGGVALRERENTLPSGSRSQKTLPWDTPWCWR